MLRFGLEYLLEFLSVSFPILILTTVLGAGGFIYYNQREKGICTKKIYRLEKKLERLKLKLYDLPIWLVLVFLYQYI